MILISVILPNYNHARFLKQRIESILCQTFQDFELIILDDASTDNSRQIIEQYRHHPKVSRIIYNRRNSGSPFKQWNKGIQLAQGKYIWIAESDDYCEPTFVETLVPVLDTNSSVGISYCRSKFIDEQGNFLRDDIIRNFSFAGDYWSRDFVVEGMEIIKKYLYHNNIIPNASAVIFRKSLFFLVKGIPSSMKQCGDWWLWIKILSMSDLAYSVKCLNVFRCHMQTTRVIDTIEKLFQRTKEELMLNYLLSQYVWNNFLEKERKRLISFWIELHTKHKPLHLLTARPIGWSTTEYWREIVGYFRYLKKTK